MKATHLLEDTRKYPGVRSSLKSAFWVTTWEHVRLGRPIDLKNELDLLNFHHPDSQDSHDHTVSKEAIAP